MERISTPQDFADFYEATYPAVLRYLAYKTGDGEAALELAAEAYAKAFQKREQFRGNTREEALGWFWAIARNDLKMYWRNRTVELSAIEHLQRPLPEPVDSEMARIDEVLVAERHGRLLRDALNELSSDQQDVIRMAVIEERPYPDIAAELDVSIDVVRARLSRGLRRLAANAAVAGLSLAAPPRAARTQRLA